MPLPRPVVRLMAHSVIAPILSPRLPVPVRRRLLDATGATLPLPRGTRRSRSPLGGVPTERITAANAIGPQQVLYLHGGGYVVGSPTSHRAMLAHLSRAAAAPVHALDYRRAPEHPFPAALDDAVAAYRALLAAGHPSQRIAVAGDSAGGGLTMSLLLRLRTLGVDLPGSVGLISPWLDLDLRSPLIWANAATDALLDPSWLAGAADDYRAGSAAPELRPLEADLAGLPPMHVIAGADEVVVGDSDALVERAKGAGVDVTYRREPGMWHAYPIFAGLLAEANEAVSDLGAALSKDCSALA
jgi:acetyl esterase/lipase